MAKRKTKEEFIENSKEVHGDFYDYSRVEYKDSKTKVGIRCPIHGLFWQTPNAHLRSCGCPDCGGKKKKTKQQFIDEAVEVHGNFYDYSNVEYQTIHTKVEIICPEHGTFWQKPSSHLRGFQCPQCKNDRMKASMTLSTEIFSKKARQTHGDWYDYSQVNYQGSKEEVEIICPVHGSFWQIPNNHLNGQKCPYCSIGVGEYYAYKWLYECSEEYDIPCLVYLIEMYDEQERFLKMGITLRSVNERYRSRTHTKGYNYTTIIEKLTTKKEGVLKELQAKNDLCGNRYHPMKSFDGWTECFTLEAYDDILELIKKEEDQ